jgi:site-specific DNA recombinase
MRKPVRKIENQNAKMPTRKRVCAYARVSGGKDAQLASLAAQVSYYSTYIQRQPEWEYSGVFADEAITGTKETRAEFQKMIEQCKNGNIDLIITKSISRFARNTVKTVLCDCDSLNIEVAELQREMEIVAELSRRAIFENAHTAMNQDEFNARNDSYLLRHKTASEKITELENLRRERYSKALLLDRFISEISSRPLVLTEFDIDLWMATIDSVRVAKDDKLIFEFKDGSKIEN